VEKLTKVDKLVRTMMLTYPTLYPDRATALFNIFTDSGTNYCWDEQGCIVQTYPSEKTWEGPIDISDLAKRDADWDRDDDFARTVRLENELERHQRLFRAEHIDLLCRYGRGGTYGYRHLNTYHLDNITAEWGCALIYRAPFGKIDDEWVRAMEEFIGDMMVAFNHVYNLHFDKPLRGEKAPEPSMTTCGRSTTCSTLRPATGQSGRRWRSASSPRSRRRTDMKRPGIREAVAWIALNDDSEIGDADTGYIVSIVLVADLWDKEQEEVAEMVRRYREKVS
jgi:hypothetical protein